MVENEIRFSNMKQVFYVALSNIPYPPIQNLNKVSFNIKAKIECNLEVKKKS